MRGWLGKVTYILGLDTFLLILPDYHDPPIPQPPPPAEDNEDDDDRAEHPGVDNERDGNNHGGMNDDAEGEAEREQNRQVREEGEGSEYEGDEDTQHEHVEWTQVDYYQGFETTQQTPQTHDDNPLNNPDSLSSIASSSSPLGKQSENISLSSSTNPNNPNLTSRSSYTPLLSDPSHPQIDSPIPHIPIPQDRFDDDDDDDDEYDEREKKRERADDIDIKGHGVGVGMNMDSVQEDNNEDNHENHENQEGRDEKESETKARKPVLFYDLSSDISHLRLRVFGLFVTWWLSHILLVQCFVWSPLMLGRQILHIVMGGAGRQDLYHLCAGFYAFLAIGVSLYYLSVALKVRDFTKLQPAVLLRESSL